MENLADIHLTLPEGLVANLDKLARGRGVRRSQLLREAVADYLNRMEAERIDREMYEYADALGPHSAEFVRETEAHTMERLMETAEW